MIKEYGIAIYDIGEDAIKVLNPVVEGGFNINEDGTIKEFIVRGNISEPQTDIILLGPIDDSTYNFIKNKDGQNE